MDKQKEFIKGLLLKLAIKHEIVDLKNLKDKKGNIIKGFMVFSKDKYYSENNGNFSKIAQKHFKNYPQQHRFYIYFELNKDSIDKKGNIIFILYNPSYATPDGNDPTINNCIQLAQNCERFSSVEILNLYSERNPNIKNLKHVDNSANIKFITGLLNNRKDSVIVLAWGNKKIPQEWNSIISNLEEDKLEIITCKDANLQIRHPGNQGWSRLKGFGNAKLEGLSDLKLHIENLITYKKYVKIDKLCV